MLDFFPGFRTRDPDLNRRMALSEYGGRHFGRTPAKSFKVRANWADTKYVRITRASCSAATDVGFGAATSIRQYFQLGKDPSFLFDVEGSKERMSTTPERCVLVPPAATVRIRATENHELLSLRIEAERLKKVIVALEGEEYSGDADLGDKLQWTGHQFRGMRTAVLQFVADLDAASPEMLTATGELGQALLVRFALSCRELNRKSDDVDPAPSRDQLLRIEEYIAENWRREIDIHDLAIFSGMGVRSIFRHFKSLRGITPHKFIKNIRLTRCRGMLQSGTSRGVLETAMYCGFNSMGKFAEEYERAFGELPSQTLREARSKR